MRLNQKVALVTSSAPGICADTAQQLALEGAKVMLCGRNATQALATVERIRKQGGRASFVLTDVAVSSDVKAAIDETIATYGRLDILFNHTSSRYPQDGTLLDMSEAVLDRVVEAILKGTFFCCQYALPFLQHSGSGTIINLIEKMPDPQARSVATLCQGGVLAMTEAIAQQFPARRVTANLIWATQSPITLDAMAAPMTGLMVKQVLYGPLTSDRPFTGIDEAVMYLACHDHSLHGSALIVNASA